MLAFLVAPTLALLAGPYPQEDASRGLGMMARPGVTYSVETSSKLAFRVDEARYTLRFSSKEDHLVARRGMKLLILRYTLTNRESYAIGYSPATVNLRVVGTDGRSTTPTRLGPGQEHPSEVKEKGSVTETVWTEIPTSEPTPRLEAMIAGSAPLKFDLNGFAKPVKDTFVGKDGGILDELKVAIGKRTALSGFDVTVNRIEWSKRSILSLSLAPGQRMLIATLTLDNQAPYPAMAGRGVLIPEIRGADGKKVLPTFSVLAATSDDNLEKEVPARKSIIVRYAIKVEEGMKPDDLLFTDGVNSGRTLAVDL